MTHAWFGGLRWRLVLLIGLAVLPSIGVMIARGLERRDAGLREMRQQTLNLARLAAQEQARRIEGARQLLIALSTSSAFRLDDSATCVRDVRALVKEYGNLYSEIGWADRRGRVVCHVLEGENLSIADREYFHAALSTGRFFVGDLLIGKISNAPILPLSYPLRHPDGSVRGVIFANIDLRMLSRELEQAVRDSGDVISILDRNGAVIARSARAQEFIGVRARPEELDVMRAQRELVRTFAGPDGVPRQYGIAIVRGPDGEPALFVGYGRSEAPLLAALTSRLRDELAAMAILALGIIGACWASAEWLVRRPVQRLVEATAALARGKLDTRVPVIGSTSEFATLAASFNQMAEKLEQRDLHLRQGQRLEAIGQLAGGIAHDFNNLLTVIVGCSALLEEHVRSSPEAAGALADLRAAADRAASLTRQLLAFGRRQFLQPRVLKLNDVVTQVQVMMRRVIGDEITLQVALDPELRLVRADPVQIEQVIVNLVLNARDAMPDGGVVRVTTRNRRVDEAEEGLAPGEYVELAVSDTGVGIDPAVQAHVFEPFFTTKGPRGTGLGLATVYGIVKQSGGTVRLESEVGKGTRFEVLLPEAADALPASEPAPAAAIPAGGSERVLVVEDEATVRSLITSTLSRQGYAVSQACDGADALEVLERLGRIDLLITDVRMPRMNGLALLAEVQRRLPGVPALLISGDSAPEVAAGADTAPPLFLQKPFTPAQLLQAAREALSRKSVPAAR